LPLSSYIKLTLSHSFRPHSLLPHFAFLFFLLPLSLLLYIKEEEGKVSDKRMREGLYKGGRGEKERGGGRERVSVKITQGFACVDP